jgi:hypothetical protein
MGSAELSLIRGLEPKALVTPSLQARRAQLGVAALGWRLPKITCSYARAPVAASVTTNICGDTRDNLIIALW